MDICDIHFAAKGHIYARLFHGHSILFIRYAALLRYCSPMRLSCLFLERRVSLSLDTVSFYDSDGSYVLLRGRTLLYGGEDIFRRFQTSCKGLVVFISKDYYMVEKKWHRFAFDASALPRARLSRASAYFVDGLSIFILFFFTDYHHIWRIFRLLFSSSGHIHDPRDMFPLSDETGHSELAVMD